LALRAADGSGAASAGAAAAASGSRLSGLLWKEALTSADRELANDGGLGRLRRGERTGRFLGLGGRFACSRT